MLMSRVVFLIILPLLLTSCFSGKVKTRWVYLFDYTVYDKKDILHEIDNSFNEIKRSVVRFDSFKKYRNSDFLYIAVDDNGANQVEFCVHFPNVQGKDNEKVDEALAKLRKCFDVVKGKIILKKEYKKTLYLEALSRALEKTSSIKDDVQNKFIIVGDLAIVDNECFLEAGPTNKDCKCKGKKKINLAKEKIKNRLKKEPNFRTYLIQTNIPKEESCREYRRNIWKDILGKSLTDSPT